MPNGTYDPIDAIVNASPPAGVYGGRIFLKAQTPWGVTIDSRLLRFRMRAGSQRVTFWGIKQFGPAEMEGDGIDWWYPDASYPLDLNGFPESWTSPRSWYDAPIAIGHKNTSNIRCRILGGRIRDVAQGFAMTGAREFYAAGVLAQSLYVSDNRGDIIAGAQDRWHTNVEGASNGKNSNFTYEDCTFAPKRPASQSGTGGEYVAIMCTMLAKLNPGDITGTFNNCWTVGAQNYCWQLEGELGRCTLNVNTKTAKEYPTASALLAAHHYNWNSKTNDPAIDDRPGRGDLVLNLARLHDATVPPSPKIGWIDVPDANDPAAFWRSKWPYESCLAWYGFDSVSRPPGAPRNVAAVSGVLSARVSWLSPLDPGTGAVDKYRISATPTAGTPPEVGGTAREFIHPGLVAGTPYTFKVAAHNDDYPSYGVDSAASNSVTPTGSVGAPSAPAILLVSSGDQKAGIIWQAPASNGGSTLDFYEVVSTPATTAQTYAGSLLGGFFGGLTNGVTYTLKVRAHNTAGFFGPYSANSAPVTPFSTVIPGIGRFGGVGHSPFAQR